MMISIPTAYLKDLGWKNGERIVLEVVRDELLAWPLRPLLRATLRETEQQEVADATPTG